MSLNLHEEMVSEVADEFRARGYKVFIIKKPIPDLLIVGGNNITSIACEITSSTQREKIYKKKLHYKKYGFDTDDLMIISKRIKIKGETTPEAYYLAMELIKKGIKYHTIRKLLKDKFNTSISSSTLSQWKKGFVKPYSVRDLEGAHRSDFIR